MDSRLGADSRRYDLTHSSPSIATTVMRSMVNMSLAIVGQCGPIAHNVDKVEPVAADKQTAKKVGERSSGRKGMNYMQVAQKTSHGRLQTQSHESQAAASLSEFDSPRSPLPPVFPCSKRLLHFKLFLPMRLSS